MNPGAAETTANEEIDAETTPRRMPVQRRDDEVGAPSPMIKIIISHGSHQLEIVLPAHSTFGELKSALAEKTGLQSREQRLLFRGKEKNDRDHLHTAGVKNQSKIILMEDPASKEHRSMEIKQQPAIPNVCEAVLSVRTEVDKLAEKVYGLALEVDGGARVSEKELVVLPELLMRQLLKLDSIEAEGEAKVQRRSEVRRVQSLVEILDVLKAKNENPFRSSSGKEVSVATQWETFESAAPSRTEAPAGTTQEWVQFN